MDKSYYGRRDRLVQEKEHDVYRTNMKLPEPTGCRECGAVYTKGRWVWGQAPEDAYKTVCPACRRIADKFPVGHIEVRGGFFTGHREEILNLVHNVEKKEKAMHPLERIMEIDDHADHARITTTGIHLARGIGAALSSAYSGEISIKYLAGENCIKVRWAR